MRQIGIGEPQPLGVTLTGDGINVAVYSGSADAIALCLFDDQDRETDRIRLPGRTGSIFHGHVPGVPPGKRYGLRAYGPWKPSAGHRFNPAKLLVDPWATSIDRPFRLQPLLFDRDAPLADDTATLMPKGIVSPPLPLSDFKPVSFDWSHQVIYELHVRGFTMTHPDIPPMIRGTYAALGHPASIAHLTRLGITTVELMPSAAWIDERHLPPLNRSNYWGYNPVAFLAPDPRLAPGGWAEIRGAVDALHEAGLSVILDVVLNHSGESDELGPTLSLRGLDNSGYYRLLPDDPSRYVNDAGCGNILAMDRPAAVRLSMDALRTWARLGGLDGFRLDLATTLGRRDGGFDPAAPFLSAVEQDPLLSNCVMVAEPWDIGQGGYQLGAFPDRWGEWNDRYRDAMRRFWRGDGGMSGQFATRFCGSADLFVARHRPTSRSVNYITAHDGFTMADLVAYSAKHNHDNGENNQDGTEDNLSWNNGVEGPCDDTSILAARARDVRALLATLLLSHGTPMLSMGDEAGRTQHGNNNAYAQDSATSWFDWPNADQALIDFTAQTIALRKNLAPLFDGQPLTGQPPTDQPINGNALPDIEWLRPDGQPPSANDWNSDSNQTVIAALSKADVRAVLVFHSGREPIGVSLPSSRSGYRWKLMPQAEAVDDVVLVPGRSVTTFVETEGAAFVQPVGVPDAVLDRLSDIAGIDPIWWDVDGGFHRVGQDTKQALLAAMRLPAATLGDCRDSLARLQAERAAPLPPALTVREGEPVRLVPGDPNPAWLTLLREDGSLARFQVADGCILLPSQPVGRHRLLREDKPDRVCNLIVAPAGCYLPPSLAEGQRRFGIAAHLYSLRRHGDQGIGDFTTLARFATETAATGAVMLGLNPLHVMFPHDRSRASPYNPSDRRFLDPIYIDVGGFPGGDTSSSYPGPVDYGAVWDRKRRVLRNACDVSGSQAGRNASEALARLAIFETISGELGSSNWQTWPQELRHPDNPGVTTFAARHQDTVRFHIFLQTLAEQQFAAAAASASADGLSLGFYRDLAVGAAPDGAEAWSNQDTLMMGVSVGAPPDPFSANGQVWCLPPPDPLAMRRDGYGPFAELLESNMRHAGALRIDHVMGLQRLFVVPDGASAALGAYVNYPRSDLLAQVALESQRSRCVVVGEDLGTVPEGLSAALTEQKILSYSVLWFERDGETIRLPGAWRKLAAACVSTHDLATLAGWWNGTDIREKHELGLLDDHGADREDVKRSLEKTMLIRLLREQGLLQQNIGATMPMPMPMPMPGIDLAAPMPEDVAAAVHGFVSASPAMLALVQADDLAGETVAVNLPGTDRERPNWRRRIDTDISDLCQTPLARAILAALQLRSATPPTQA